MMRMNRYMPALALLLIPVVSSCSLVSRVRGRMTLADLAASNQTKLARLSLGMTKAEVVTLMGTTTADTPDGIVNNPWTVEGFTDESGARFEVLYYITRPNPPFTPVGKSLATPVMLKDGKLVGWGAQALERVK